MSKQSKTEQPSAKEALRLNWRAAKIWWELMPKVLIYKAWGAFFEASAPYLSLWFSAQLLGEVAGARRMDRMILLAVLAALSGAVFMGAAAVFRRLYNAEDMMDSTSFWFLLARKMQSMDFARLDDPKTKELYDRIVQVDNFASWGLRRTLGDIENGLPIVFRILGGVILSVTLFTQRVPEGSALAWLNSPLMGLGFGAALLAAALLAPLFFSKAEAYFARYSDMGTASNRFFGFFGYIAFKERSRALDIRTYAQDGFFGPQYLSNNTFDESSQIARWCRGPIGLDIAAGTAITRSITGIAYVYVCLKAWAGAFGVGQIAQYVGAITSLAGGVSELLRSLAILRTNTVYLRTVFEFLDLSNDMYQGSLTTEKRSDREYDVEFRHVSFRYPGSGNWALKDVNLKFKVGERLAVVGPNGSGKTTMIKLLCRMYDPTEGEILLNSINIRKYDYDQYLAIFSVVFQDFQLLSQPLGENVAGAMEYDRRRARNALETAGLAGRLESLPQGLDTYLYRDFDTSGVEVSGGEAQKIAIARALYKDAPFIVLDEPTAALDPIAEAEVYAGFDTLIEDRTAIYISHRLSSCKFCDRIAVFENGSIVQSGTHDGLLAEAGGTYERLWEAQAQYYT